MRWQKAIRGVLDRWSDQVDPFGHELRELAPFVVPVVSLGDDFTDDERPLAAFSWRVGPAGAGFRATLRMVAPLNVGFRIERVWVEGQDGNPFMSSAAQTDLDTFAGLTGVPLALTWPGARTPAVLPQADVSNVNLPNIGFTFPRWQLDSARSREIPWMSGTIFGPGAGFVLQCNAANQEAIFSAAWREWRIA